MSVMNLNTYFSRLIYFAWESFDVVAIIFGFCA